jgi:hypothetical protein
MTKIRSSPRKKTKLLKVSLPSKPKIKKPRKSSKDSVSLELKKGDVALVVGDKESTLYLPAHLEDDDPVPEHMQLMCAMAVLFKNDPNFRKYIKKRWVTVCKEIDENPEFQKEFKINKPRNRTVRRKP